MANSLEKMKHLSEGNEEVGLGFINKVVKNIEYNKFLDRMSDIFLIISIVSVLCWAVIGFFQLIKRKSLFKVDKEIVFYGLFLVAMAGLWIVFDNLLIVNYRPILVKGELEPSYPSTHVMVVVFTLLTSMYLLSTKVKNRKIINFGYIFASLCIIITFIFRIFSGMHWISDCVGGLLLSLSLFYGYLAILKKSTGSR